MAFNVLFGSRLLPKALATRTSSQPAMRNMLSVTTSCLTSTTVQAVGSSAPAMVLGSPVSPRVGSRIWYRVPGWQGPGGWVLWLVGWTSCAGFMQEIAGPYIFFHE
eukprot:TRINITY_DN12639_c0_g2_i1.p1 TRINITY_DN12639_c0_g2~~TRINITY_DN12639_c0_g2_i1.p1  ORF type:complete len:122 (-),score=14.88 TRINITY_DN12639_c0_g2_i1:80-397(-)